MFSASRQTSRPRRTSLPDPGFAAVPYSQTSKAKPPILLIPPKSPLRSSKYYPDSPPSIPSVGFEGLPAPRSSFSHESTPTSPSSSRRKARFETSEADNQDRSPRLPGYWDELEEFIERPAFTWTLAVNDSLDSIQKKEAGASFDRKRMPRGRETYKSPSAPESITSDDSTRKRRGLWSQVRKGRKSISTISLETISAPTLSPVPSEDDRQQSGADSDSSGCSMHTPTSAQCPLEISALGPLISIRENNHSHTDMESEGGGLAMVDSLSYRDERESAAQTRRPGLSDKPRKFPLLVKERTLPLVDLPHTLTVSIPNGALDILDMLAF